MTLGDALRKIEQLKSDIENLKEKNQSLKDQLDHANFVIRTELEPRIARENRAYDRYVTDPERG